LDTVIDVRFIDVRYDEIAMIGWVVLRGVRQAPGMPYVSCGHCGGLNYLPRSYLQAVMSCPICGTQLDPRSHRPRALPWATSVADADNPLDPQAGRARYRYGGQDRPAQDLSDY